MGDEKTSPHLAAWPRPGFLKFLPVRPYRASSAFIESIHTRTTDTVGFSTARNLQPAKEVGSRTQVELVLLIETHWPNDDPYRQVLW